MDSFDLKYYVERASDWVKFSTVPRTFPPSFSHNVRKIHGGIKPPELIVELIVAYANNCSYILDPFVGVGSTLIASFLLGKKSIGIDINPNWKEVYNQVCKENNLTSQKFLIGNSPDILNNFTSDTFDFLITDVPYFSMDKLKKTRGKFSRAGEPSKEKLKSSLNNFNELPPPTYDEWSSLLKSVFSNVYTKLKSQSLIIIFIGNMYRNFETPLRGKKNKIGKYLLLSSEVAEILTNIGYIHLNELIWVDTGKKLGIYGYPYTWIPSLIDQRILIFQKK